MRAAYVTEARVAELRDGLTPGEWALLRHVEQMRVAVATDLQALAALDGPVGVRSLRRQLARLSDHGVLARLEHRRIGGRRSGSAGYIYTIGLAGQRLLHPELSATRSPWVPRPAWLHHALTVSQLYVRLREAEAAVLPGLETFQSEPRCWRTFTGPYGERLVLKPDAFVVTVSTDYRDSRFVEVDMGTESPATLTRKFGCYERYWRSGHEQQRTGVFPAVLWIVPDQGRLGVLLHVAARQASDTWALHHIVTSEQAVSVFTKPP